jgi:hypothetical protein
VSLPCIPSMGGSFRVSIVRMGYAARISFFRRRGQFR